MPIDQFLVRFRGMNVGLGKRNNYTKNIYLRLHISFTVTAIVFHSYSEVSVYGIVNLNNKHIQCTSIVFLV
jgi:hypothetical protein